MADSTQNLNTVAAVGSWDENRFNASRSDQDANNHDMLWAAQGKSGQTILVVNLPNKALTVTVYGAQTPTSVVNGDDVIALGSFSVPAAGKTMRRMRTVFPFYIVRCAYAEAPTDNPAKSYSVYVTMVTGAFPVMNWLVGDGRQTVTTSGTPVQLSATAVPCAWALLTMETDNTGLIIVGASTVVATLASRRGNPYAVAEPTLVLCGDLTEIWLDTTVNGDGCTYTYGW